MFVFYKQTISIFFFFFGNFLSGLEILDNNPIKADFSSEWNVIFFALPLLCKFGS